MLLPAPDTAFPASDAARHPGAATARIVALVMLALGIWCFVPQAASAQDAPAGQQLKELERRIQEEADRARRLAEAQARAAREAREVAETQVRVAREAQALENEILELRSRIAELQAEEAESLARLEDRRERVAALLSALGRIARNPPEAIVAHSDRPGDTLRGAILLRAALAEFDRQTAALKKNLKEIARLREDTARRERSLAESGKALAARQTELDRLLDRRRQVAAETRKEHEAAEKAMAALAAKASDMRDLIERLARQEAERKRQETERRQRAEQQKAQARAALRRPAPFPDAGAGRAPRGVVPFDGGPVSKARGRLVRPVSGKLAARFGDQDDLGQQSVGLRFTPPAGARVLAPYGGQVVFAGPFRGYGQLLIIDHGEGYHTLLSGLGRIDAAVNQKILAGEPVGMMDRQTQGNAALYMELRRDSRPIDPLPWLAKPATDKVSG